ncbi:DUF3300 domain-containing protein [Jeongeupia chitinilytica]|uniref:DUF3300 domain-containing protein n=1 Tax=Jeongeupia chitinilytica TaxID=1041641 RepID=A0ABQ3GZ70_9NEIS|nr:DUF3300 domain-containing protein [Jeongeupia chitinilytica]GHD62391.1 hypothetical protein GCM10007350_18280 [Jeongeupia chitinilytica]
MSRLLKASLLTAALISALPPTFVPAHAADAPASAPATTPGFTQAEIEQLVAPIALHPDSLLAQIFMASTYPLEVVQAQRWRQSNAKLSGKALETAVNQQPWDASVKALTAFPQVLQMMNDKLDWTQKLGDAFLADQKRVMDAVQVLRQRAQAAGNLKSGSEQTVTVKHSPGSQGSGGEIIVIEPAQPETVYVPVYNPTVVYGTWPYPYYTPYYWYPPGYVPGAAFFSFTAGIIVGGAFWGWGNCNWGGGDIDIDINNNFNRVEHHRDNANGKWQHKPEHRRGVEYRDNATKDRFRGQDGARPATHDRNRDAFRGRAEQGRQDLNRLDPAQRDAINRGGGDRAQTADRQRDRRDAGGVTRPSSGDMGRSLQSRQGNDALRNVQSPGIDRAASDRGRSSRASISRPPRTGRR